MNNFYFGLFDVRADEDYRGLTSVIRKTEIAVKESPVVALFAIALLIVAIAYITLS
jgi:hypothetical protein